MMIHKHENGNSNDSPDSLRARMDAACHLLANSHQVLNARCNEFEALLDAPDRSQAAIQRSNEMVRAAGLRSMGLTTEYLTALNAYMQELSSLEAASKERDE